MITEKALLKANILAKMLDEKGLTVEVKENSPLSAVLPYVQAPDIADMAAMEMRDINREILRLTLGFEDHGVSGYDHAMDTVVSELSPQLKETISFFKNEANPFIVELSKRVIDRLSNLQNHDVLNIKIEDYPMPEILFNQEFLDLVDKFKANTVDSGELPTRPTLPEMDEAGIRKLSCDYPGLTEGVLSIVNGTTRDKDVYRGVFQQGWRGEKNMELLFNHSQSSIENMIVTFVMALNIAKDVIPNSVGSLEQYHSGLKIILGQSALGISNYVDRLKRSAATNTLIMAKTPTSITTNPITYKNWMENDGDIEALYGMAITGGNWKTVDEINQKKEYYINEWSKYRQEKLSTTSAKYLSIAKDALIYHFVEMMNALEDVRGTPREEAIGIYKDAVSKISGKDLEDLYTTIRKLVCLSRFSKMDMELFLSSIDKAVKDNPELDIKEAALVATVVYVATKISDGIVIKRK